MKAIERPLDFRIRLDYYLSVSLINQPLALSRRREVLGASPDLLPGESLIQMASESEVMAALALMAEALGEYYAGEPPVCVPIKRAAAGTMALLRNIDPALFSTIRPVTISTTDGQRRLDKPRISQFPVPEDLGERRVLIVDGVVDTGHTLVVARAGLNQNADDHGITRPRETRACAAVVKLGATVHDLDGLLIAAAMTADKGDWVVGIGDGKHDGFDLSDRFRRDLPGVWHIQTPSP